MNLVATLHDVVHWPTQGGYNFVSGPLADITILSAFLSTLFLWWRRHNCHVFRCWRLQWHPHPVHGHPVCKVHHPDRKRLAASEGDDVLPEQVSVRAQRDRSLAL